MRVLIVLLVAIALFVCVAQATKLDTHESIVEYVNKNDFGWKAKVHARFAGKAFDFPKRLCGALTETAESRLPEKDIEIAQAIPDSFDARDQWGKQCPSVLEVRDQSDCGSCWAFATVEAGTDRICIQSNGTDNFHLSAEDMAACEKLGSNGCNGGQPSQAWTWMKNRGVVTGGNYGDFSWCRSYSLPICEHHVDGPYPPCGKTEYPTPPCTKECDSNSTYKWSFEDDLRIFKSAYSVSSNVQKIQTEIMTNGPVGIAISVYSDFPTYTSGVYTKSPDATYLGGHAIKMLGWGTLNGVDYWLCANSWNETWGDNGFVLIKRGVDECGIEDQVVAGMWQ